MHFQQSNFWAEAKSKSGIKYLTIKQNEVDVFIQLNKIPILNKYYAYIARCDYKILDILELKEFLKK